MSSRPIAPPYSFPTISGVHLTYFDLYRQNPNVVVNVDRPVFCLIGANGLGKSSFLNTLLYGLTGGLPYRERSFSSPREYAEEATRLDRRDDYYGGRLSEAALEHAAVTVELRWPSTKAVVTRQLFGPGAVIGLEVESADGTVSSASMETDAEGAYKKLVVSESRIPDFDQFIFLLHYVCSFDEDRHLLLWDPIALTNSLYLAFGSDAAQATTASALKRDVERFGSRARNSRFAARQSLDEANRLRKALDGSDEEEEPDQATVAQYTHLNKRLDEAVERLHRKDAELRKAEALVSDRSAALTELQLQYEQTFAARATGSLLIKHHPLIRTSIRNDACAVCGAADVGDRLRHSVEHNTCPLCNTAVATALDDQETLGNLRALDQTIEEVRAKLQRNLRRRARLKDDYETALQAEAAARDARDSFLIENPNADRYARTDTDPGAIDMTIKRLQDEAERFSMQSKREYEKRDRARRALLRIERELQSQFEEASARFTDLFRSYAEAFIGLDVDIELEHRKGRNETGFELLLSLEDHARSRADDVSESQRFFLDIALRMALTEFMSAPTATLLIDTPEGSLDITYEARAGDMFSNFAAQGNAILMTANLRSSALLRRLADRQARQGMAIERMTDWTDLSEVQRQEEALFVEAYREIERALR